MQCGRHLWGIAMPAAISLILALVACSCGTDDSRWFFPQGPPAEPRVELFGDIRDSKTKSPIVGVNVHLREVVTSGDSQGLDLTTISDDFGTYAFYEDLDFLHAGTFAIHASHPRYEDYISGPIELKASVDVTEVSFEMRPIQ